MIRRALCAAAGLALACALTTPATAATPAGRRGATLTPAEEAQQTFLRSLRSDGSLERALARHADETRAAQFALSGAPPAVLAVLTGPATVAPIALSPAQVAEAAPGPCVQAVDDTFRRLELLVQAHLDKPLVADDAPQTADTGVRPVEAPRGS